MDSLQFHIDYLKSSADFAVFSVYLIQRIQVRSKNSCGTVCCRNEISKVLIGGSVPVRRRRAMMQTSNRVIVVFSFLVVV